MFNRIRVQVLRLLRVPPEPEPPIGAPGSLRVFRAGKNLYKLRLARWGLGQAGALAGIVFSVVFLESLERGHDDARARLTPPSPAQAPAPVPSPAAGRTASALEAQTPAAQPTATKGRLPPAANKGARATVARIAERTPWWLFPLLKFLELAGIAAYLVQIPLTYALVRLDYELRWYLVTDRSLRIRTGITTVQESTMSFANLQQVVVTQGPLQGLLGLADVRVQSAGGGGDAHEKGARESLHTGVFHGVENAHEIRDLILERLRQYRETGLGDPDEPGRRAPTTSSDPAPATAALAAAHAMLEETRALRRSLAEAAPG